MNEVMTREILELNESLDARVVLEKMGFEGDAIYEEGDQIRIYCPIHRDIIKRSMIIEKSTNEYKCQHKQCDAHEGGPLIQLYAMFFGLSIAEAVEHLNSGPKDQSQLITEADRLIDRGELSSAIPVLKKVLEEDPTNEINRCKLAALYLELGDKDGGFKEYLRAAEDFAVRGHLSKTVGIYKLLIIIAPNDISVRHNMFHIFCRLKKQDEAIEQAKLIGDHLFQAKAFDKALNICKEMLEVMPAEPNVREFLAKILAAKGDLVGAAAEIETAAKLYFELGRISEARMAISLGLKYTPNNSILKTLRSEFNESSQIRRKSEFGEKIAGRDQMSEKQFFGFVQNLEKQMDQPDEEEVIEENLVAEEAPAASQGESMALTLEQSLNESVENETTSPAASAEESPAEPIQEAEQTDESKSEFKDRFIVSEDKSEKHVDLSMMKQAKDDDKPIFINQEQEKEAVEEPEKPASNFVNSPPVAMGPANDSQVSLPEENHTVDLNDRVSWIKENLGEMSEHQIKITTGFLGRVTGMAESEYREGHFGFAELSVVKELYTSFNLATEQISSKSQIFKREI